MNNLRFILFASVASVLVLDFAAADNVTTSLPISQLQPRGGAPSVKDSQDRAEFIRDSLLIVFSRVNDYRINKQTEAALKVALKRTEQIFERSPSPGILLRADYQQDKTAELYSDLAPLNLTRRLVGDQIMIVGGGSGPVEALALDFSKKSVGSAPSQGTGVVDRHFYWVTRDAKGKMTISEPNPLALSMRARDIFLDQARYDALRGKEYRQAISDMLASEARGAKGKESRDAAAALLKQREEAVNALAKIDEDLKVELEKAKKANKDADTFAIIQALAGAGSAVVDAASEKTPSQDNSKGQPPSATTSVAIAPMLSGEVLLKVKQRLEVEGKIRESDVRSGAFFSQNGKVIYVDSPL